MIPDKDRYILLHETRDGIKIYKDKCGRYYKINRYDLLEELEVKYLTDELLEVIHRDRHAR